MNGSMNRLTLKRYLTMTTTSMIARRRWLRFSCRTLLVMTTLVCVWLGVEVKRARDLQKAVALVSNLGGQVVYDYEQKDDQLGFFSWEGSPAAPGWLRTAVGEEFFVEVNAVNFIEMQLDDAAFERMIEGVARLRSLKSFGLECSRLTGRSLRRLDELGSLQYLVLHGVDCSAEELECLRNLRNLQDLCLSGKRIEGDAFVHLGPLKHLASLAVRGDWFDDGAARDLASVRRLDTLNISSNSLTDAGLAHLSGLPTLTCLLIDSEQITDDGLEHVGRLTRLERLVLTTSQSLPGGGVRSTDHITGEGFIHLRRLANLTSIDLFGARVDAAGFAHLQRLPKLESLRIENGRALSAEAVDQLKKWRNLKFLETPLDPASEQELYAALPGLFIYNP